MDKMHSLNLIEKLVQLLGAKAVLARPEEMQPYLVEGRDLYQGKALAFVRPCNTAEVSKVVSLCHEAGVTITPQGGNTGLVGGQTPSGGIILSLSRMNSIRAVDSLNGTITVDAGVTLQSVQEAAARADSLFPLSLASQGSCQIGGNIASNAGGTAVLRYGNMRELVLGLEVVLPDGRIWNGLRSLRKDNSGYDLKQMFIGSEGTLGIITGAVLKLFPKIRSRVTAFVGLATPEAALELFERTRRSAGESLSAFEIMPRFGIEIVVLHMSGNIDPLAQAHAFYTLIELSSASEGINLQATLEEVLGAALEDGLIEDATIGQSEAQSKALWSLREDMSWAQKYEGGSIKHDISVPVASVAKFISEATHACEAMMPGLRVCAFGHMGDGNIHFNLSQPTGMDKAEYLSHWGQFNRVVHDIVMAMEGSIAAEHGIGQLKLEELQHYKDEVSLDLMRVLKHSLDPNNLFNPGKVITPDSFRR